MKKLFGLFALLVFLLFLTGAFVTAQGTHSITISWPASTSSGVTGYNVYKAASACAGATFTKINTALITGLTYSENGFADGVTRCYYVTAVSATAESAPSGTIQITMPTFSPSTALIPPAIPTATVQ